MKENELKIKIGFFLIISHLVILIPLIIFFYIFGNFTFEEMTTSIALIIPMFSAYLTLIINFIIENRKKMGIESDSVTKEFVFLSFLLPSLFVLYIFLITILTAFGKIKSFAYYKAMLAMGETVFGIYAGYVLKSLFESKKRD
jgi:hypothetical protein